MVVTLKAVIYDVAPYRLLEMYKCFRQSCCLYHYYILAGLPIVMSQKTVVLIYYVIYRKLF